MHEQFTPTVENETMAPAAGGRYAAPMISDVQLIKAFIIVQGNRIIRYGPLDLAPFEGALGTGLSETSGTALLFEAVGGQERTSFQPWMEALLAEGLRQIGVMPAAPELATNLLALDLGVKGRQLYAERWERGVPALPSARSLLAFVRRHPGEGLEQRTAYYAREFGLISDEQWAEVERTCDPQQDELWVQAFELAQSHVEASLKTGISWEALVRRSAAKGTTPPVLVFAPEPGARAGSAARGAIPEVAPARASLERALQENLSLAEAGGWTSWIEWFAEALERLETTPGPEDPWVQATSGCGIPGEVVSLALAAQKSHVFGGMGSWNDMPCDNAAQRELLWRAMLDAWGAVFAALEVYATAR